jgi:hypothetical protein
MPSFCCTMQAVLGKLPKKSGVELATMIRSISLGCRPAMASRCWRPSPPGPTTSVRRGKWRAEMPLR